MKGEVMSNIKQFLVIALVIGFFIIMIAINLDPNIFLSAIVFAVFSGTAICLLSLKELYSLRYVKMCPICGEKVDVNSKKCKRCNYHFDDKK